MDQRIKAGTVNHDSAGRIHVLAAAGASAIVGAVAHCLLGRKSPRVQAFAPSPHGTGSVGESAQDVIEWSSWGGGERVATHRGPSDPQHHLWERGAIEDSVA